MGKSKTPGMTLVRSLSEQPGGTMEVAVGDGTSFEFRFRAYEGCRQTLL